MIVRGFTTNGTGEKLTPFPCGPGGSGTDTDDQQAVEVPYDNSGSGLTADDVQEAIDELAARVAECCDAQFSQGDLLSTGEVGGGGDLVLIQEVTTSGSQAHVTFSSIPATYRDLEIRVRGRSTDGAADQPIWLQFNGDTGANYSFQQAFFQSGNTNNQAGPGQTVIALGQVPGAGTTTGYPGGYSIEIFDYRGTTLHKAVACFGGEHRTGTGQRSMLASGTWHSTAAINAVKVFFGAGNHLDGNVVSLYGRM